MSCRDRDELERRQPGKANEVASRALVQSIFKLEKTRLMGNYDRALRTTRQPTPEKGN